MVIEIQQPKQEGYNSTLNVKSLAAGDYVVISVDGYLMNGDELRFWQNNPKYGKSYMAFVDVFEYSYFDTEKRQVIDKKFPEPVRCSYFMSEAIYNKIQESKVSLGQALKLGMVSTKTAGRTTWNVTPFNPSNSLKKESIVNEDEITIEDVDLPENSGNEELLKEQIAKFREAKFSDANIISFLKGQFTEEEIKRYL